MKISILTLFPNTFTPLFESILGRAVKDGKIEINVVNIRDYTLDKHFKCDDTPFGGGAGMVMMVEPIYRAIQSVDPDHKAKRIYLSPKGKTLSQALVKELSKEGDLLLLCGHYEGVDQRAIDLCIDEEVSIGDYVLTGGELGAMVLTDAVCRCVDGVLNADSLEEESFSNNRLEYPQYTRPAEFMGVKVPAVLLSGNHREIKKWREIESDKITLKNRPDLLKK